MFGLEYFGFKAIWSPLFLIFIVAVGILYWGVTGPWRHRFPGSAPVHPARRISFLFGLFLIYLAQGGPLDLLAHLMFSAHMLSMSISFLVAPAFIWKGIPEWLIHPVMGRIYRSPFRFLMRPLVTLFLFNVLFSVYHIPLVHDTVMTTYWLHTLVYIVLYVASFLMWWPIAAPSQAYHNLSSFRKMAYVFAAGALLTPACALIIFAGTPVYATYNDPAVWARALGYCVPGNAEMFLEQFGGPGFFNPLTPVHDQQLGGVIMKLVQEFSYAGILYSIFHRWYRTERKQDDEPDETPVNLIPESGMNRA